MDFEAAKQIPFERVLMEYGVHFTETEKSFNAVCPLPNHPEGEKTKTFSVNKAGNFFRCFSRKCNDAHGGKRGGDVVAFVALMSGCNQRDALNKLAELVGEEKGPAPDRRGPGEAARTEPRTDATSEGSSPAGNGKSQGYMKEIETWLVGLLPKRDRETDGEWFRRVSKEIKQKLYASYKSGQASVTGGSAPPK